MKNLIVIFTLLTSILISGQDSLSLSNAISIGLIKNYDIQLTNKNVSINKLLNNWGEAGAFPKVTLNSGQNNNSMDQINPASFFDTLNLQSNNISGNIALSWTIFNGFNVKANKLKMEQLVAQSEGSATLAVENTIHGIILSYYQVKLQIEQLTLLKNVLDLSREKYKQQLLKSDLGLGVKVELLQFENAYLTDSSNLIMQELSYKNSLRNLNLIMGEEINKNWTLSTEIKPIIKLYNFEDLKNEMISNNTNIKNQFINISLLNQDIQMAKSAFFPILNLNAGSNIEKSVLRSSLFPGVSGSGENTNYYANFTLSFKLYDGGKVRRGIKALEIQNEINDIQSSQIIAQLTQELSNTYDLYNTRLKIFEINKKAFLVAEENFNIAKMRENNGVINSFTLRDIEMSYLSAGLVLFQSSFNLLESNATLLKLTGKIIQEN
ncbi:MAG: hypothetical protein CL846_01075 [Crocinitomicaceae bacterium]|nr:hypothetical protein [Crocinitomicaceae bacterium]